MLRSISFLFRKYSSFTINFLPTIVLCKYAPCLPFHSVVLINFSRLKGEWIIRRLNRTNLHKPIPSRRVFVFIEKHCDCAVKLEPVIFCDYSHFSDAFHCIFNSQQGAYFIKQINTTQTST